MKKLALIVSLALCVISMLASCDKAEDSAACYEFTIQTATSGVYPGRTDYATAATTRCNLTEEQAESVRKSLESTATAGGVTTKTTATKRKL